MRILIAEDDKPIAEALKASLTESGYAVDCVADGASADHALLSGSYELLVLDLGLPRMEGNQVLKRVRANGSAIAVMVVTARDSVAERVRILDIGADDYLVKPFELSEFLARTRALLRRRAGGGVTDICMGRLRMRLTARRVWLGEEPMDLTAREYSLLEALFIRQSQVVTRSQLVESLCAWDRDLTDNGLDISIHRLRRKLAGSAVHIKTIRGLGYLLEPTDASDKSGAGSS